MPNSESYLIAAITACSGAVVFLFKLILSAKDKCEVQADAMAKKVAELEHEAGNLRGKVETLSAVLKTCSQQDCPTRSRFFSVE